MIQIFYQNQRIFLAFFQLHRSCPVNVQKTQHKRANKNNQQADDRKELDESEGFYFVGFCQGH